MKRLHYFLSCKSTHQHEFPLVHWVVVKIGERYPFQHCHPKMAVSKWSKYTVYISFLVDRNTTGN